MKERVLSGWNFRRIIYVLIGGFLITQSVIAKEWIGLFLGAYVASMGLFAIGCAAGNCFTASDHDATKIPNKEIESVDFEEIK